MAAGIAAASPARLLSGTRDVALVVAVVDRQTVAPTDLRARAARRLAAARIAAEVREARPGALEVTVRERLVAQTKEVLLWPGGVAVYEIEGPLASAAPREGGLLAAAQQPTDPDRVILVDAREAPPELVLARSPPRVVLQGPPMEALPLSLSMRATTGMAVDLDRALCAIGHVAVRAEPIASGLRLSWGGGPEAYGQARRARRLLETATLPALVVEDQRRLPLGLGAVSLEILLPLALSLAWLVFVRRFDRAHPEPWWLVAVTFAMGAGWVLPASLVEAGLARSSPWLNPEHATLGGQARALPIAIAVYTLVVGATEETAKAAATFFATTRREFDEPIDGIVYAVTASLGFAALENVRYFGMGRLAPALVMARGVMTLPAHRFFGALWGYALGARLVEPRSRFVAYLAISAVAHGAFDAFLATEGTAVFAVALDVLLAAGFVVLVRRALRHSVVQPGAPTPDRDRRLIRTGRPVIFAISVLSFLALAVAAVAIGALQHASRERLAAPFVASCVAVVGFLAVAAWGITRTLPLDVAVDPRGVTFAGAFRGWGAIRGTRRAGSHVVLESDAGDLLLGPAPSAELSAIEEAIATARPPSQT